MGFKILRKKSAEGGGKFAGLGIVVGKKLHNRSINK